MEQNYGISVVETVVNNYQPEWISWDGAAESPYQIKQEMKQLETWRKKHEYVLKNSAETSQKVCEYKNNGITKMASTSSRMGATRKKARKTTENKLKLRS